jgi:hypothetical protein
MLELLRSIKKTIERKVVNIQTIRSNISVGETTIPVRSAKRFEPCTQVVIYREGEDDGEIHTIDHITDYHTIVLQEPLIENYSTSNTRVQNVIEGVNWVRGIYIGDPPVIPRYPAITIYGNTRSSEWLTLESTSEKYDISISVYIEAAFYDKGYEYVLNLTKMLERTLYANLYPLTNPFFTSVLINDVTDTDTVIRVEDDDLHKSFAWFFLENDLYTRHAKPKEYLGSGVIELVAPVGVPFSAGDDVIFPGRHFYDCRPQTTEYGNVVKNSLLWGSRISYFATEEALRPLKFYEPLNRP